jgi:hypothetical protein
MNSVSSKVIVKKLNRLNNVNKHTYKLILNICNGITQVRPVYKVPNKKTIINVHLELIEILNKLNIKFVVSNDAPKGGQIGLLITIKTRVINGNNKTKVPKIKRGTESRNEREFNFSKENIFKTI